MKNILIGVWILFTLQTLLSYIEIRDYADDLAKHHMNDHCADEYRVEADIDWNRLRVDYSLHCTLRKDI